MPTKINPYTGQLDLVNPSGNPGPDSGKYTVNDYTDNKILTSDDFNQIHRMTSSVSKQFTLPAASSSNKGKWLILVKKGAGALVNQADGSDLIEDASSISCVENISYAKVKLVVEESGLWGVYSSLGTWSS